MSESILDDIDFIDPDGPLPDELALAASAVAVAQEDEPGTPSQPGEEDPKPESSEPGGEQPAGHEDPKPPESEPEPKTELESKGEPNYYTPEELDAIMAQEDAELDTSRLNPEGKAIDHVWKRKFTQNRQEIGELRRQLEDQQRRFEQAPPAQQRQGDDLEQAQRDYDTDPQGTVLRIDTQINQLRTVGPMEDNFQTAQQAIGQFEMLKDYLVHSAHSRTRHETQLREHEQRAQARILAGIPDIATKAEKLVKHAGELGYAPQQIQAMLSVAHAANGDLKRGEDQVVANILAINRTFDQLHAGEEAEKKLVKSSPPELERSRNTKGESSKDNDDETCSMAEYARRVKEREKRRRKL